MILSQIGCEEKDEELLTGPCLDQRRDKRGVAVVRERRLVRARVEKVRDLVVRMMTGV